MALITQFPREENTYFQSIGMTNIKTFFESLLKCSPLDHEVCSVSRTCRATISSLKPHLRPWWATQRAIELHAWSEVIPLQPKVLFGIPSTFLTTSPAQAVNNKVFQSNIINSKRFFKQNSNNTSSISIRHSGLADISAVNLVSVPTAEPFP